MKSEIFWSMVSWPKAGAAASNSTDTVQSWRMCFPPLALVGYVVVSLPGQPLGRVCIGRGNHESQFAQGDRRRKSDQRQMRAAYAVREEDQLGAAILVRVSSGIEWVAR